MDLARGSAEDASDVTSITLLFITLIFLFITFMRDEEHLHERPLNPCDRSPAAAFAL
jgi:hypothetical protein